MTKVTIVGAGQSGLQLGIGLVQAGYDVTAVSNRTPDEIRDGRVTSSQCMFADALSTERSLGINFWDETCPPVEGIAVSVPHPEIPGAKAIDFAARLDRPAQSVDQRVKFPRWMEHFESIGGTLVIHDAGVPDLERYADDSDLVIVASGKGEIGRLFPRDDERSQFDQPMRSLALTYVTGMTPRPEHSAVCLGLCPGVGEYFGFPAETVTGRCEIMVFEGVPGGPMDCWGGVSTLDEHLAKSRWILERFFPWEAARCEGVELTDPNGILVGRITPTVRRAAAALPSGRPVLGVADAILLNDPITGQGSNNAAKGATHTLERIIARGAGPFDEAWMLETFDLLWESYAKPVVQWTNGLLLPPPQHVLQLLGAACGNDAIAHRFVNGFDDPRDFQEWFMTPDAAERYLAEVSVPA